MNEKAKALAQRLQAFSDEIIAFAQTLSGKDWAKTTVWEQWPVGAAVRHLVAGHFAITGNADMIARGEPLPPLTMDQINEMSEMDVRAHLDCSKTEALEQIRKNSAELIAFVSKLSQEELERKGDMPALGGSTTTGQFIDLVVLQSGRRHLDSIRKAVEES